MTQISVRGLDGATVKALKREARRRGTSVNRHIVDLIRQSIQPSDAAAVKRYDDLDFMIGGWTEKEAVEFRKAIAPFGEIDAELWR